MSGATVEHAPATHNKVTSLHSTSVKQLPRLAVGAVVGCVRGGGEGADGGGGGGLGLGLGLDFDLLTPTLKSVNSMLLETLCRFRVHT